MKKKVPKSERPINLPMARRELRKIRMSGMHNRWTWRYNQPDWRYP